MISLILNSDEYFTIDNNNTMNDVHSDLCIRITNIINRINKFICLLY